MAHDNLQVAAIVTGKGLRLFEISINDESILMDADESIDFIKAFAKAIKEGS